ncbi:MAG: xanthine dehydrogenase family protein molybdopterin-binding subunit [Anaerolineae bacterium]
MKKKGIGIACNCHPTGLKGGGDPSQAQIRLKPDGTADLLVGAVDIGQGSKTVLRQIAAEVLDVPLENITLSNFDTDMGPLCTGTFASRVTFMDGNAVIAAAEDLKQQIREWAAEQFEARPEDLVVADNKVYVKDDPERASMAMAEVGAGMNWGGKYPVAKGAYFPGPAPEFDSETGEMPNIAAIAYGACVVEVEVDTETGVVDVKKLTQAYEIGRVINPLLVQGQIDGGTMHALGFALSEDVAPYYPSRDFEPANFTDYIIMTAADVPEMVSTTVEVPQPDGPYGAKGFSEMTASTAVSAIISAIHDATGVWIYDYPATPEKVLRALEAKETEQES